MTRDSDGEARQGSRGVAPAPDTAVATPVLEFPLAPAQNIALLTPGDKLFVLAHLGVPRPAQRTSAEPRASLTSALPSSRP